MQPEKNTIQVLGARKQIITTLVLSVHREPTALAPPKPRGDISTNDLPGTSAFRGICVGGVA